MVIFNPKTNQYNFVFKISFFNAASENQKQHAFNCEMIQDMKIFPTNSSIKTIIYAKTCIGINYVVINIFQLMSVINKYMY